MKVEMNPAVKVVALVLLALALIALVIVQGPDMKRYLKMETM